YASGTVCVAGSCMGSTLTPARTCNGSGACLNVVSSSCTPYICGAGACKATCASNADCLAPNTCTGTTCGGAGGAGGADGGTGGCPGFAFCDDFEDGNANGWTPNGGNWAVLSDGTFVYKQSAGTSPAESFAGSSAWTDLTVQARMKVTQWGGASASFRAGVYARYRDTNTYYAAQVRADGKMEIRKKSAGLGNAVAVSVALNEWHTIKLQVSGPAGNVTVTGFLDGVMVLS